MKKLLIIIASAFTLASCASNKAHCDAYGKAETIQESINVEMV